MSKRQKSVLNWPITASERTNRHGIYTRQQQQQWHIQKQKYTIDLVLDWYCFSIIFSFIKVIITLFADFSKISEIDFYCLANKWETNTVTSIRFTFSKSVETVMWVFVTCKSTLSPDCTQISTAQQSSAHNAAHTVHLGKIFYPIKLIVP